MQASVMSDMSCFFSPFLLRGNLGCNSLLFRAVVMSYLQFLGLASPEELLQLGQRQALSLWQKPEETAVCRYVVYYVPVYLCNIIRYLRTKATATKQQRALHTKTPPSPSASAWAGKILRNREHIRYLKKKKLLQRCGLWCRRNLVETERLLFGLTSLQSRFLSRMLWPQLETVPPPG